MITLCLLAALSADPEVADFDWDAMPVVGDKDFAETRKALGKRYDGKKIRVSGAFVVRGTSANRRVVWGDISVPAVRGEVKVRKALRVHFMDKDVPGGMRITVEGTATANLELKDCSIVAEPDKAEPLPAVDLDWEAVPASGDRDTAERRKEFAEKYEGKQVRATGTFRLRGGGEKWGMIWGQLSVATKRGNEQVPKLLLVRFMGKSDDAIRALSGRKITLEGTATTKANLQLLDCSVIDEPVKAPK